MGVLGILPVVRSILGSTVPDTFLPPGVIPPVLGDRSFRVIPLPLPPLPFWRYIPLFDYHHFWEGDTCDDTSIYHSRLFITTYLLHDFDFTCSILPYRSCFWVPCILPPPRSDLPVLGVE